MVRFNVLQIGHTPAQAEYLQEQIHRAQQTEMWVDEKPQPDFPYVHPPKILLDGVDQQSFQLALNESKQTQFFFYRYPNADQWQGLYCPGAAGLPNPGDWPLGEGTGEPMMVVAPHKDALNRWIAHPDPHHRRSAEHLSASGLKALTVADYIRYITANSEFRVADVFPLILGWGHYPFILNRHP